MEADLDQILAFSPQEQIDFEKEQNIYSIIKTIEYLEWAYMSGKITGDVYDQKFKSLFHHFDMCRKAMQTFDLEGFFRKYQLEHCITAKQRIQSGTSSYQPVDSAAGYAAKVFDVTQKMISALDVLALQIYDIDQVLPPILDIQTSLDQFPGINKSAEFYQRTVNWVQKLQQKDAASALEEDEAKRLKLDLEMSLQAFRNMLDKK